MKSQQKRDEQSIAIMQWLLVLIVLGAIVLGVTKILAWTLG